MIRSKVERTQHPNPFYPGAYTLALIDPATERRQSLPVWADTTRAEFIRLARYHLRKLREPLPVEAPKPGPRFFPTRRDDDDLTWT